MARAETKTAAALCAALLLVGSCGGANQATSEALDAAAAAAVPCGPAGFANAQPPNDPCSSDRDPCGISGFRSVQQGPDPCSPDPCGISGFRSVGAVDPCTPEPLITFDVTTGRGYRYEISLDDLTYTVELNDPGYKTLIPRGTMSVTNLTDQPSADISFGVVLYWDVSTLPFERGSSPAGNNLLSSSVVDCAWNIQRFKELIGGVEHCGERLHAGSTSNLAVSETYRDTLNVELSGFVVRDSEVDAAVEFLSKPTWVRVFAIEGVSETLTELTALEH